MDRGLLTIGQFSRLSGLSAGALRHYDELALLSPAAVDPETGYRRYAPTQLAEARTIARLRALQMPLDEISAFLHAQDARARAAPLTRHRARIEARSIRAARILHSLAHTSATKEPPMPTTAPALDQPQHRALGAGLFNRTWELLETEDRTPRQTDELIHTAHASAYHWSQAAPGAAARAARAEWLCARVYSVLGRPEPAVAHAHRCLELLAGIEPGDPETGGREDWDLAGAYEALARAHALAGDRAEAERWIALARREAASIADPEDRGLIERDVASIELPAMEPPG